MSFLTLRVVGSVPRSSPAAIPRVATGPSWKPDCPHRRTNWKKEWRLARTCEEEEEASWWSIMFINYFMTFKLTLREEVWKMLSGNVVYQPPPSLRVVGFRDNRLASLCECVGSLLVNARSRSICRLDWATQSYDDELWSCVSVTLCFSDAVFQWSCVSVIWSCFSGAVFQWSCVSVTLCFSDAVFQWSEAVSVEMCFSDAVFQWSCVSVELCFSGAVFQWSEAVFQWSCVSVTLCFIEAVFQWSCVSVTWN